MKPIQEYENAIENQKNLRESSINRTMFCAYRRSRRVGTEDLNFEDIIWDTDVDYIVDTCKREGIERITISSTFSQLIEVLDELGKRGCAIEGTKLVPISSAEYNEETDTYERKYAHAIIIKIN